jgi:hypothetical protein
MSTPFHRKIVEMPGQSPGQFEIRTDSGVLLESLEAVLDASGRLAYEGDLAATRRQLGEAAFTKAWEEGSMMTIEKAVGEAMSTSI